MGNSLITFCCLTECDVMFTYVFYNDHSDDRTGDRCRETGGRDIRRRQKGPKQKGVGGQPADRETSAGIQSRADFSFCAINVLSLCLKPLSHHSLMSIISLIAY